MFSWVIQKFFLGGSLASEVSDGEPTAALLSDEMGSVRKPELQTQFSQGWESEDQERVWKCPPVL